MPFSGAAIVKIIVNWGLFWGPPIYRNPHIRTQVRPVIWSLHRTFRSTLSMALLAINSGLLLGSQPYSTTDYQKHHVCRFLTWELSKIRDPNVDSKVVGLFLSGHQEMDSQFIKATIQSPKCPIVGMVPAAARGPRIDPK